MEHLIHVDSYILNMIHGNSEGLFILENNNNV
jgi:hypothetical protein